LRIVSLLPSATEIVCALGLESDLVGITHECDYPPGVERLPAVTASRISHQHMSSAEIDHAVRGQLQGHGSIYDLDEKLLFDLKPDLILTQELCDVCAVSYKTVKQAARLFQTDVKVVSLEPNTIADVFDNLLYVGELTGVVERARVVVSELQSRLEAVRRRTVEIDVRPRTLMLEWIEPPFAPGHWVPEQVGIAGGDQAFGNAGKPSITTTGREIQEYDPDVVVLIPCGFYKEDIVRQLGISNLPEGWDDLRAVRDGKVWAVDATSYFSRPGPRLVDGVEILSRILHPKVFGEPTENQAILIRE
jgi:iron complex transport system substrate-binding protein